MPLLLALALALNAEAADIRKACAKECPKAKTVKEAFMCAEELRAKDPAAFEKKHKKCFDARQKYENTAGFMDVEG